MLFFEKERGLVAELADAIGLGPIVRKDLWVRVPPGPLNNTNDLRKMMMTFDDDDDKFKSKLEIRIFEIRNKFQIRNSPPKADSPQANNL